MQSLAEDGALNSPLQFASYGGTAQTTKTTAAIGLIDFYVSEHDGANALADITADGNWTVRTIYLSNPTPITSETLSLSGRGQQASQNFHLNQGLAIFKMTHDGSGYIGITLLDDQGNHVELLAGC